MSKANPYSKSPVHITQGSGKMCGIVSINTSTKTNSFCQKMQINQDSICKYCYAERFEGLFFTLHKHLIANSELLSSRRLAKDEIPVIYQDVCRINSYGELINETHYRNICAIAETNPHCTFTLWTKRLNLVSSYRPVNLTIIYSNPKIDDPLEIIPHAVDGVFNVITAKYAISHNIHPNCTGHCRTCMRCYSKFPPGVIYEILKSDQKKFEGYND